MEHRALALEYRPQRFDEVTGQHHVTAVLARALAHGRIHHCYLFSGPRGVGKTTTARILAKVLNCPHVEDGVPCNACDVCRDITAGVSLDVQEIDGASNRGIADVQQLRERVRFASAGGRYKVIIIDEVHQLSADAFAALLKTLEEPPPHVVFVFATTDPLKLPDTIRSRCQRYDFGRLPLPAIVERLRQITARESGRGTAVELTDEAAFLLARKSEGSMRDAVSALDQILSTGTTRVDEAAVNEVLGLVSREVFFALGERILGRDPEGALAALHGAYRDGGEPRDLAEGLLDHLRSILVLRVDPAAEDLLAATPGERERFTAQGSGHDTPDLLRHMRIASEALGAMRDSGQPLTHLEAAVVEMASLEPGVRLAEILERLGALEGAEPAGGGKRGLPAPAPATRPATRGASAGPHALEPARESGPAVPPAPPPVRPAETPYRKGLDVYGPDPHLASERVRVIGTRAAPLIAGPAAGPGAPDAEAAWDRPGAWEEVVARVKDRKLMVGVFLAESRRAGWEGASLCLAADEVHKSLLEARENRELLCEILKSVYGRPIQLRFVDKSSRPFAEPAPEPADGAATATMVETATAVATSLAVEAAPDDEPALAIGTVGDVENGSAVEAPLAAEPDAPDTDVTSPREANGSPARVAPGAPTVARGATGRGSSDGEAALSPEVREAMIWFEGEIVRRPDSGGVVP